MTFAEHRDGRLVLYGREFVGFERALARQAAAFDGPDLEVRMLDVASLERRVTKGDLASSGEADILLVNTDWLASCIADGLLVPLDDYLKEDPPPGWPDAWSPALLGAQSDAAGHVYGLPYHDGPVLLLYRTDLYGDPGEQERFATHYGRALAPPATWEELVETARWFTRPSEGLFGTVLAGYPDGHNNVYDLLAQMWCRGTDVVDSSGTPTLCSPVALEAATFLWELWHENGVIDPAAKGWDSVQSGMHFAAGEAACMVNWCGFASLSSAPSSPTHGLVGCAPAPGGSPPHGVRVTMSSYWVLAVPRGAADPRQSYRFLRHVATPEMDRITAEEQACSTRLDSWSDPAVQALAPYFGVLERVHVGARSVLRDRRWPQICDVLNDAMREVIVHGIHPEQPLTRAQRRLEGILGHAA